MIHPYCVINQVCISYYIVYTTKVEVHADIYVECYDSIDLHQAHRYQVM
jgi:hypothetical protein